MSGSRGLWALAAATVLSLAASGCDAPGACSSSALIAGRVLNNTTGGTVASAFIALQRRGVGSPSSSPNAPTPQYALATAVDSSGNFNISTPCGAYNVWAFAPGFVAAAVSTFAGQQVILNLTQADANAALPQIGQFAASSSPLPAGRPVSFTAQVQSAPATPLTEQVLLINPSLGRIWAMAPPLAANGNAYPNGLWRADLASPSTPGTYRYALVATDASGHTALAFLPIDVQR